MPASHTAPTATSANLRRERNGARASAHRQCGPGTAKQLPTQDLGRPIRVVVFGGAFLESAAQEFVAPLAEHREVALVGGFCQSRGFDVLSRIADVVRRRRLLAPFVLARDAVQAALRFARHPRTAMERRRNVGKALSAFATVPDIHAASVLQRVDALAPDLGLIYGAPILKPQLFELPTYGTLGIHHGRLPEYRGKKTTFWAMFNGESTAGVAIQRINAGLDRGEIVCSGEVSISGKRYGRVASEVQQLGLELYMAAIVAVKRGKAVSIPQQQGTSPLYRQPFTSDIVRLWYRQLMARRRGPARVPPGQGR
jgi:folate-dependent phosphoribosylglycinamide formyltransferase PurN